MSNTPKEADDCQKLLDNGHVVVLFKNPIGSYTAAAMTREEAAGVFDVLEEYEDNDNRITDDFLPSQALYRLTEKATTGWIA